MITELCKKETLHLNQFIPFTKMMVLYFDIDTPEKYEHWHRFYVERWGFTETGNEIILRIPD